MDRLGNRLVNSAVTAGIYGDSIKDALAKSTVFALADEAAGYSISKTADKFGHGDLSLEKLAAKAVINCVAQSAARGECSAGGLGTVVAELLTPEDLSSVNQDELRSKIQLASAFAGYLTSGGDADSVYAATNAATTDFDNNAGPAIIVWAIIALTAADYALTAKDAVELTKLGLACDKGDIQACSDGKELLKQFAQDTTIEVSAGAFVPGSKVGTEIVRALRKHGDEDVVSAVDEVVQADGGHLLWGNWNDYPKVTTQGRQYAKIGDRLYTRHAVDRMQPSGLGTPAGSDVPGRNVTPNMIEDVISSGESKAIMVDGTLRTIYKSGNVSVVTENGGRTIVTILRNSQP